MQQKEQASIAYTGKSRPEPAVIALFGVLFLHHVIDFFPFHAKWRVAQTIVESGARMSIVAQGIAELDLRYILALDEHIALTDRIGLRVEFLPGHDELRIGVETLEMLLRNRQHSACASGRIVQRADRSRLCQRVAVLQKQEVDHQGDHFTGRKVLPCGFVREFGEFSDQLLEHKPHIRIGDDLRMEIDLRKLLCHEVQEIGDRQSFDLIAEFKLLEDVAHIAGKARKVTQQVWLEMIRVGKQLCQVEFGNIVEAVACDTR